MRLCCDRTGFPLLRLDALGLEVGLLPCAKVQFEAFLAEPDERFGDAWYEAVLAVNPRDGWRLPPAAEERLFLTGVLPDEALAFLRWLGPGFDLPSVQEWLEFDAMLRDRSTDGDALGARPGGLRRGGAGPRRSDRPGAAGLVAARAGPAAAPGGSWRGPRAFSWNGSATATSSAASAPLPIRSGATSSTRGRRAT